MVSSLYLESTFLSILSFQTGSNILLSIPIFVCPSASLGQRVGQVGIKNSFLSLPTLKGQRKKKYSITQSSYSLRCSKQGVVSNVGGMDTGELKKPRNDIIIIICYNLSLIRSSFKLINIRVLIIILAFSRNKQTYVTLKSLITWTWVGYKHERFKAVAWADLRWYSALAFGWFGHF